MPNSSVTSIDLSKFSEGQESKQSELLAVEEPLEILIQFGPSDQRQQKALAITMRTPGQDIELATGFLYTEGIVKQPGDLVSIRHCQTAEQPQNTVKAILATDLEIDWEQLQRHFYISSSCGVCGKASIESVAVACPRESWATGPKIDNAVLGNIPEALRAMQSIFPFTGGVHAAALFDTKGHCLALKEDVGRHNALDKLVGYSWQQANLPWSDLLLVLSGRVSFELMQKALMAGARTVIAMGAPSNVAVDLAREFNVTLIGFLKKHSFNIYHQTSNNLVKK